jgi:hypothetical protein
LQHCRQSASKGRKKVLYHWQQLLAAQRGMQLLCCDLPSAAAGAPAKLSEDLLKMNSYLSAVCQKYLEKGAISLRQSISKPI